MWIFMLKFQLSVHSNFSQMAYFILTNVTLQKMSSLSLNGMSHFYIGYNWLGHFAFMFLS